MAGSEVGVGRVSSGVVMEYLTIRDLHSHLDGIEIITPSYCKDRLQGGVKQTDLILITTHKIYVIEVKSIKKWIRGEDEDAIWHISTSSQGSKDYFEIANPVKQNQKHIEAIQSQFLALGLQPPEFENIVIVSRRENVSIQSKSEHVYNLKSFLDRVNRDLKGKPRYNVQRTCNVFKKLVKEFY